MKKLNEIGILKHGMAVCIAAIGLLASPAIADAKATAFSRIIVFGDSLSDTGNFYRLTAGYPPPPYASGRFSNGRLWIEYVAENLGMELLPGDDYAVGGATTGGDNSNDRAFGREFPGLRDQIAAFVAGVQGQGADPDALYTIWAGANDFFVAFETGLSPNALIANGVANTMEAIQTLRSVGARHILVANVPDLGLTPYGRASGLGPVLTQLSAAYNHTLAAALQALADSGAPAIQVDAFATLEAMATFPAEFGFTNVTDAFLAQGGNAQNFLFWDAVHPTTRAHEVLGDEALTQIIDYFSPARGNTLPPARVNALNGLVNASGQH